MIRSNISSLLIGVACIGFCLLGGCAAKNADKPVFQYEENWESISHYKIPEWFKDAKLGIFIHWGPASASGLAGWYGRNMYMPDSNFNWATKKLVPGASAAYKWHVEKFGDPKEFGYKELIPLLSAENFNAREWVGLFKKAGAKYVVPVAEHHDGFAMYDSKYTKWKSTEMGPNRDILGELFEESRKQGLYTGASSHFAFHWNFFRHLDGYDTNDPQYAGLYGKPHVWNDHPDQDFMDTWWNRTRDIIDNYQPDILWFDFFIDKPAFVNYHTKLAAYYYNKGLQWNKEVVLQTKNYGMNSFPPGTHVLDLERGLMDRIRPHFWQTDTSVGSNAWFYKNAWKSRTPNSLIDDFIDMVSKNGSLLLNVGPDRFGNIPREQECVLLEMGGWLGQNGEAIYGTRAWKVFGEGPTKVKAGHKTEQKDLVYTGNDIRFTQKGNNLYAIALDWPGKEMVIRSLGSGLTLIQEDPVEVKILGYDGKVDFARTSEGMVVKMPEQKTNEYAVTVKLTFAEGSDAIDAPDEEAGTN